MRKMAFQMTKNIKFYIGVKALIMNSKNELLLLKAAPPETKFEQKKIDASGRQYAVEFWDFPGGRIKAGESMEDTLMQECKEEIGIENVKINELFSAVVSNFMIKDSASDQSPLALIVYKCEIGLHKKIVLSHEHSEYKWFSPQKAKPLLKTKYPESFIKKLDELIL